MSHDFEENMKTSSLLFRRTDCLHRRIFEKKVVTSLGIHRSQHMLLMCLADNDGISQKAIAHQMKISPAAVAVTIKKLESGGFIERQNSADDGRQNIIALTEKGSAVIEKTRLIFTDIDKHMISGISKHELRLFASCLERMYKNLDNLEKNIAKGKSSK